MAIAYVSGTNGEDITGSGVTSLATSSTMNVASGNLLVAFIKHSSGVSISSVTDGGSNSFTDSGISGVNSAVGQAVSVWYKQNATANATATITANFGSTSYPAIGVVQFSGVATSSAYDTGATGFADASGSVTSGSFTPAQTNSVAIAGAQENTNGGTWTADADGYTSAAGALSGTAHEIYVQYDITIPSGAQTVTAANDFGQYKSIAVVVFKEAGGGGGSPARSLALLGVGT